jgi:hypothetical protein
VGREDGVIPDVRGSGLGPANPDEEGLGSVLPDGVEVDRGSYAP